MTALPFSNRAFMQACWVVPDLRAAIGSWVRSTGVGPFFWMPGVSCTEGRYRGKPADLPAMTAAIAYAGDMQIELVCQDDDQPSMFRDLIPKGASGLHHMAIVCTDYERERDAYVAAGAELAFEGRMRDGIRTSWVDTSPTLGFMVELIDSCPARERLFARMKSAADDWDGRDPVVPAAALR
jgi:hypothetical protein